MHEQTKREAQSLSDAIRQACKAAYRLGKKERKVLADFVYEEIADWRTRTNTQAVWLDYILRLAPAVSRSRRNRGNEEHHQYHFFDDLDHLFPIKRPEIIDQKTGDITQQAHTEFVMLGDFGLTEIYQHDRLLDDNIVRATAERNRWDDAKSYVIPLLKRNKKWAWRDAVEYLRKRNALPDLGPALEPSS